jgi:eukaryotic-like serine/threonine-protein kinase
VTLGSSGELFADRYRLVRLIGQGGFGEVWHAIDTHRSNEPTLESHSVALKLVTTRDRRSTWQEASILTALKSDHILEVNNADVCVDVPYIDTDLAATSLDKHAMPLGAEPEQAVAWMRRALRGLELCHQHRLLHRDVKPANIFLTASGAALLGDFGLVVLMDERGTADIAGDHLVWAPEFFTGGKASAASDIYAAGVTLYALLAGRMPYAGFKRLEDLADAVTKGTHEPLRDLAPHVSIALADKVKTAMAINASDRFGSAADFDNALALHPRARRFIPASLHPGHLRCWSVIGRGRDMHVCALQGATSKKASVLTTYADSGRRITRLCCDTTHAQLAKRLRAVFGELRDA